MQKTEEIKIIVSFDDKKTNSASLKGKITHLIWDNSLSLKLDAVYSE